MLHEGAFYKMQRAPDGVARRGGSRSEFSGAPSSSGDSGDRPRGGGRIALRATFGRRVGLSSAGAHCRRDEVPERDVGSSSRGDS